MSEQYIGCQNSDYIIICDSTKKECCIPVRDIFLVIDLEKHVNGKLALSYFNYKEDHADFLVIKIDKDENERLTLEVIEFERVEIKSEKDIARSEELIKDGILLQLLYFYVKIKKLLEEKLNLKVFPNIEDVKLLIVVPQGVDGMARKILDELKRDYRKVLDDFLSQNSKKTPRLKEKLDEVKRLIGSTGGKIVDRIAVTTCENFAASKT